MPAACTQALPTPDERKQLSAFKGAVEELGPAEQFVLELGKVPHVGERLQACKLLLSFGDRIVVVDQVRTGRGVQGQVSKRRR